MMEGRQRRFSMARQVNPGTMKVLDSRLDSIADAEGGAAAPPYRKNSIPHKLTSTIGQLALFRDEDEDEPAGGQSFISGFTTPGPKERATSAKKKVGPARPPPTRRPTWASCWASTFPPSSTSSA